MATPTMPTEDLIKCTICKDTIKDPKALPCLHTFCLLCLKEWTEHDTTTTSTITKSLICPVCKKPMSLPDDGVDGLPGNFFVSTLMERSQVLKPMNVACVCCNEMGSKLIARCVTCDGFLCEKGMETHQRMKFLNGHQVVNLKDLKSGKVNLQSLLSKKPTCSKHEGQALWFFCETCGMLICQVCTVVNHKSPEHTYVELDCATKEQRREIQQLVEKSDAVASSVISALDTTRSTRKSLDSNAKQALLDIDKAEEQAIACIHKIFQADKDKLTDYVANAHAKICGAEEILVSQQAQLKRAQEMATQVLDTGSDYDIASVYKQLKTSLQGVCGARPSLPDKGLDDIAYTAVNILDVISQQLGTLTIGTRRVSSGKWVLTKEFGKEGPGKMSWPRGVAITPSGDIAVANYSKYTPVLVYNTDGQFKFSLDKKSSNASNVAISCDSRFFVTTYDHRYVTIYCPKGQYLSEFPAVSPLGVKSSSELRGLAINSQNQLLVGDISAKYISIHDLNGSHLSSIDVPIRPMYIASTKENHIVISAHARGNKVHVIDINGKPLVTIYGSPDVKEWFSCGVCVSINDEICIVNHRDKCIHCFSVDGKYLRCIYKGLSNPDGMTLVDMDNKILVAERGGTLKVLTPTQ